PRGARGRVRSGAAFAAISGNASVWAGWIVSVSGLLVQGVVFTFLPLLAHDRGFTPAAIGLMFGVLGLANTFARFPARWLMDRTGRSVPYAIGGGIAASVATGVLPHVDQQAWLLTVLAIFGAVSGTAGVAIGAALAESSTPAGRR